MKKLGIVVYICLATVIILGLTYPRILQELNFIVLILTLGVLIRYTYDTNRIANQTIESNFRPVILRSGYIHRWDDIKFKSDKNGNIIGKLIQFTILKNIAKDIKGYIVVNGYKHELLFGTLCKPIPYTS